jgi:hypothetical protein
MLLLYSKKKKNKNKNKNKNKKEKKLFSLFGGGGWGAIMLSVKKKLLKY